MAEEHKRSVLIARQECYFQIAQYPFLIFYLPLYNVKIKIRIKIRKKVLGNNRDSERF